MITLGKSNESLGRALRSVLLAGAAVVLLSACASNRVSTSSPDFSGQPVAAAQANLASLAQRYQSNPRDKQTAIYYAAALRANGQSAQAVAVIEATLAFHQNDAELSLAYAKALAAAGRFNQALNVVNETIRPEAPDWNALSVKGAVLDQMGQNQQARQLYQQALLIAPDEASLYANMGLSYAMSGDLDHAEQNLRTALTKRGATSQIRQNLALVLGLKGRFDEARSIYAAELPPDQVEANMAYIRALLTQQNRWDVIEQGSSS
ncbi:MAG: tetratricopeptide repeat protein [Hyphomicrobiaceae bacterium]|nr:tetratricopeptide repeat protein [Hyphomicrobiaceae bacterium]